ncbi:hypothetical protein PDE_03785 [Penicillium oxalicum 114-2]|uniref:Uncharacterized protein n=1 Tax=Penicillium oxalicum (strain 114-2 / CGMCC 5302) TaxID=933388 RepID=S7ZF06_PENO1|nr:hypothetical protein PDE_03785 [Penicillium oxalicum 114-2]
MGNSVVANRVSGSRPETPDKPDTDIVRTLSPVASPAGQATAPEGRRNNKKKKPKRTGKKKDVRNAEPVGTALPEASTEPQSTVLASPSLESGISLEVSPLEMENVGPCVVDTDSWRRHKLAQMEEKEDEEAGQEAALLETTTPDGGATAHSRQMSGSSSFQTPMQGQSVSVQRSQEDDHNAGSGQPLFDVNAGASWAQPISLCSFLPACGCHNNPSSRRHTCCCTHGAAECWFYPVPPLVVPDAAPQQSVVPAALHEEASRVSQSASPESSLGEPSSEPLTNHEGSFSVDEACFSQSFSQADLQSPSLYFDAEMIHSASDAETAAETRAQGSAVMASEKSIHANQAETAGSLAFQTEHVKSLFGNPEFADMQLLLSPVSQWAPVAYPLHKAIIAASPFLHSVMAARRHYQGPVDCIRALTGTSFSSSVAFAMALRTLYGHPLVNNETLRMVTLQGLGISESKTSPSFSLERAMVDFALCYAASGAFLARHEITKRGIDLAISHLSWETAEVVLNFGINPASYMVTCPDVSFTPMTFAGSWSSFHYGYQVPTFPSVEIDHFHDFRHVQAKRAQTAAFRFISGAITPSFKLYHRAQARFTPNRIPASLHTLPRSFCTNFRLEEIQFGSMPSYTDLRPTDPAILVPSAMLITLPYRVLRGLTTFMNTQGNLTNELLEEVMDVREERRLHALRVAIHRGHSRVHPDTWEELGYQEFMNYNGSLVNREWIERPAPGRVRVGHTVPFAHLMTPLNTTDHAEPTSTSTAEAGGSNDVRNTANNDGEHMRTPYLQNQESGYSSSSSSLPSATPSADSHLTWENDSPLWTVHTI